MASTPPNWPLPAMPLSPPLPATPLSPRPVSSRSTHSHTVSADVDSGKRLSAIEEDRAAYYPSGVPIPSSPASATRGTLPRAQWPSKPRRSVDSLPPKYTLWDVTGPRGEKLRDLRNNKQIARRGGWKRLLCVLLLLVGVAVGLGVGLGVGLVKNQQGDSAPAQPTATGAAAGNGTFPQGSYTFAGALATVDTACTSNPATFLCWPYTTYNSSEPASAVAFDWVVSQQPSGALALSSSQNPFAISFSNTSLTQHNPGTPEERYSFSLTLDKYVVPTGPIDGTSGLAACWFNTTTLAGNLWTRRPADGGAVANGTANSSAPVLADWPAWQFAFDVNQTISGGQDVPECYQQTSGGGEGARITSGLTAQASSDQCGCYWRNYAL